MDASGRRYATPAALPPGPIQTLSSTARALPLTCCRPQLPALSYLNAAGTDLSRDGEQHRNHNAEDVALARPLKRPLSPSAHEQSPRSAPSPFPHGRDANGWSTRSSQPPEPRRYDADEVESMKQRFRQSLPSLTEALNQPQLKDVQQRSPQPSSQQPSQAQPVEPASSLARPSYPLEPRLSYPGYPQRDPRDPLSATLSNPPPPPPPPSAAAHTSSRHPYSSLADPRPRTSSLTGQAPPPPYSATSPLPPEQHNQAAHGTPTGHASIPYGYTTAHARPAAPQPPPPPPPPPPSSMGPVYQPSAHYGAPPPPSSASWKSDGGSRYGYDDREPAYRESVKRHLEMYDLAASFDEISSTSRIMMDFSRRYGERLDQAATTEPTLSMLPSVVEIEDMLDKSRVQLDSLSRIREAIISRKIAFENEIADRRAQAKMYAESHVPGPGQIPHQPSERPVDGSDPNGMANGGAFVNGDAKKRRGRAAPPGRCHSCNRAETPEWRRGPDGARTLCNACGLHYAKLTRKQAGANKAAPTASSNLRPKE